MNSLTPLHELATRWNCSVRTIQRMRARGVDIHNPVEVIDYVLNARTATDPQLNAALREAVSIHDAELSRIISQPNTQPCP
jgi:hypothetical protein